MMNNYISEIIYGGVDGLITTFAIIAGSSGANFSIKVLLILSISSIFADGFSMGISSYLAENARINSKQNSYIVGLITFLSFIILGSLPLIPYLTNFIKIKIDNKKK
jgi:putative effector of murein hydrolase